MTQCDCLGGHQEASVSCYWRSWRSWKVFSERRLPLITVMIKTRGPNSLVLFLSPFLKTKSLSPVSLSEQAALTFAQGCYPPSFNCPQASPTLRKIGIQESYSQEPHKDPKCGEQTLVMAPAYSLPPPSTVTGWLTP